MKLRALISIFIVTVIVTLACVPAFAVSGQKVCFYLNFGGVTINEDTAIGYDYNGNLITADNTEGYIIRQLISTSPTKNTININSAKIDIELDGINIDCSDVFGTAAFMIDGESDVRITLKNVNSLCGGDSKASLEVGSKSSLTIDGNGTLNAVSVSGGAAIGGGGTNRSGEITINSGTIYADGSKSTSGAGIGGGCNASGNKITINGGSVVAYGGQCAAGIGGGGAGGSGGEITINGGTVTAYGGVYASGIGGGRLGRCATVVINSGSVKATAGSSCDNSIGGGNGRPAAEVVDSDGNVLTLSKVDITTQNGFVECTLDGVKTNIECCHPDDSYLYLWLADGEHKAEVISQDSPLVTADISVADGASSVQTTIGQALALKSESSLDLAGKLLSGDFSSIQDIKEQFVNENLTLLEPDGTEVENYVGFKTGQRIELKDPDVLNDYAEIVVKGDVNGDGEVNGMDAVIAGMIQAEFYTDYLRVQKSAADFNSDDLIDDSDILGISECGIS